MYIRGLVQRQWGTGGKAALIPGSKWGQGEDTSAVAVQ